MSPNERYATKLQALRIAISEAITACPNGPTDSSLGKLLDMEDQTDILIFWARDDVA